MAFKRADGFDHYNSVTDLLARSDFLQWQSQNWGGGDAMTIGFPLGLSGFGKALSLNTAVSGGATTNSTSLRAVWAVRNQEAFIGFRMKSGVVGANSPTGLWMVIGDSIAGTQQFSIHFDETNYSIAVYTGNGLISLGTLLYVTNNNVWMADSSFFFEMHIKIATSGAGVLEFRINSVSVTGGPVALTTQHTANAWFDVIDFFASPFAGIGASVFLDDIYYCDTASDPGATANNTFLGDVGARTLFATGDGTVAWTPNSGGNNYSRVNETSMDSDTTYVSTSTPGTEDRLDFGPLINVTALIVALQVTIAARKDDVGPRVLKTGLDSGGTISYGANHSLGDTYIYFTDSWILDPHTGANWTRTAVNAVLGLYNLVS